MSLSCVWSNLSFCLLKKTLSNMLAAFLFLYFSYNYNVNILAVGLLLVWQNKLQCEFINLGL